MVVDRLFIACIYVLVNCRLYEIPFVVVTYGVIKANWACVGSLFLCSTESVVMQMNDSHLIAECLGSPMVYDMTHIDPKQAPLESSSDY